MRRNNAGWCAKSDSLLLQVRSNLFKRQAAFAWKGGITMSFTHKLMGKSKADLDDYARQENEAMPKKKDRVPIARNAKKEVI
jgi:hypothetical protein